MNFRKFNSSGLILVVTILVFYQFSISYTDTHAPADPYLDFVMESYDKISDNYWMQPGNYMKYNAVELPELFGLALNRISDQVSNATTTNRDEVMMLASKVLSTATTSESKKALTVGVVRLVLTNLVPIGKADLYSREQVKDVRQDVSNINPNSDLYGSLGIDKSATPEDIAQAYTAKSKILANATSSESQTELKQIIYAKEVLTDGVNRNLYDQAKIEPTINTKVFGDTVYIYIKKMAPTTIEELVVAIRKLNKIPGLTNMIIDLRGNLGGSLEIANAFASLFLGPDQYSFDLYRNEKYEPIRTTLPKIAELARYREIAVITDNRTQSTAEVTTAILKRQRIAHVVGTRTAGWGTVENTYILDSVIDPNEQYSLYLVNNLTLNDNNQPIEGRGIVPDIDITVPDWKSKMSEYFYSKSLISTLKTIVEGMPISL